jgi:hypothetical protein
MNNGYIVSGYFFQKSVHGFLLAPFGDENGMRYRFGSLRDVKRHLARTFHYGAGSRIYKVVAGEKRLIHYQK